jgi:cyclopropane-fatty-acyl-phospholipid synthase
MVSRYPPAQLDHATECIRANGLQEAVRLQLKDYRDVTGSYDRVVSIEMLEAVGEAYWPLFFKRFSKGFA